MAKANIPNVPTSTQKKPKWVLYLILIIAFILFWIGIKSYRSTNITKGEWQLWWEKASEESEVGKGNFHGVFRARIEEISPNYIRIVFPGAEGKMLGGSEDGCLYKGVWNDPGERDPKKKMSGKWHFRFVSRDLIIGWLSNNNETEKRIIVFQKK